MALQDLTSVVRRRSARYRRRRTYSPGQADGNLIALDSKTGTLLWRFQTGGRIGASPMTYSVDGKQFVAVSAGNVLYSFALPDSTK